MTIQTAQEIYELTEGKFWQQYDLLKGSKPEKELFLEILKNLKQENVITHDLIITIAKIAQDQQMKAEVNQHVDRIDDFQQANLDYMYSLYVGDNEKDDKDYRLDPDYDDDPYCCKNDIYDDRYDVSDVEDEENDEDEED